jgi:hypothetical protein
MRDGVILAQDGIEYLGFLWIVKLKASYADIEDIELLPYYTGLMSVMFFRYGLTPHWICKRSFCDIVVIKLKGYRMYKNLLFTPKDAATFIAQLKSRIEPCADTPKT